jgi:hypothetical protein
MKASKTPGWLALALLCLAPVARAQNILPSHFGAWTANGSAQTAEASAEARAIFMESALEGTEARNYSNGSNGPATVKVTLYRFHDSSGAYEGYTYLLGPQAVASSAPADASAGSATSRRAARIGNIVLVVDSADALPQSDQDLLSRQVESKADKTPPPPIPNYLPDRDRVARTELYSLGPAAFRAALTNLGRAEYAAITDEAGFNSGAEAMFARYRSSREEAVLLLLIEYPTPQLAGLHWKHLEQALPAAAKQHGASIERKGSLLAIVLSTSSPAYAARVREAVNYETQVTWNEPTHTITDPPITSVLVKIITATGAFMLVAIVFGVAFGGVRVLMKRLFPGKVFDRPEQMDVLQLGLSGKRINSRDFY